MDSPEITTAEAQISRWVEQMTDFTRQLHYFNEMEEVLKFTVEKIHNIFNYDRILIYNYVQDGIIAQITNNGITPIKELSLGSIFTSQGWEKYRRGEIIKVENVNNNRIDEDYLTELETPGVQAKLVVPIITDVTEINCFWGLIIVHQCLFSHQWQELEIQVLKNIAIQLGIVLPKIYLQESDYTSGYSFCNIVPLFNDEELYLSLIKTMTEGIVFHDREGRIINCNGSAEKILGLTRDEIMGRTSLDPHWRAIYEDGTPFVGENHPAMLSLKTGNPQTDVIMGVHKPDGDFVWISINSQPLLAHGSDLPYGVVVSFQDITEKKSLELALQQSEALFRGIFEQASTGITIVTETGKFFKVNQKFMEMVGYSEEELQGLTFMDITHPEDRGISEEYYEQIMSAEKSGISIEKRYLHKQGSIVWVSLTLSPVYDQRGNLQYGLGVSMNISERKKLEESLQYRNEKERLMYEISQNIRQSLALQEILQTTVSQVRDFLNTDRVIIYQFNDDNSGIVVAESCLSQSLSLLNIELDDRYFKKTKQIENEQYKIINVRDIYRANYSQSCLALLQALEVRALLIVPIVIDRRVWGLLIAHHCRGIRHWESIEEELLSQLSNQLSIAIKQSELHEEIKNLALLDGLTEINNRYCFERNLQIEWERLMRGNRPLSLILCDLDFFKQYNDTYGHTLGDECLKKVAKAIRRAAKRSSDLVFRYGGEEFVLLLPNTSSEDVITVVNRLRDEIYSLRIEHRASRVSSHVTLSMGVATMIPNPHAQPLDLINQADRALYQAKNSGRDRYFIYQNSIESSFPGRSFKSEI